MNQLLPHNYYPTSPLIGNAHSAAAAEAYANSNVQGLPYGYNPVDLPYQSGYGSVPGPLLVDGELGPNLGYLSGSSASLAEAAAQVNAEYDQLLGSSSSAQANALSNAGVHPLRSYPSLSPGYQSGAEADAFSSANSGYNPLLNGLEYGPGVSGSALANSEALNGVNYGYNQYLPLSHLYQPSVGSAESEALASANSGYGPGSSVANALANANSGYGSSSAVADALAGGNSGYNQLYPGSGSGLSALAEAEAAANANLGYNSYLPGYQPGSLSAAEAEALASANSGLYSGVPSKSYGSANALSEAYSNVNSYPFAGYSPYGPSYPYAGGQSGASAEAEALANSNLYSGYGPQVNPLYGSGLGGSSKAQAQALANAALGQASKSNS